MVRKSSITVNYTAFQEVLTPTLIEIIEALQRCKGLPTLSEIARRMKMSPSNLWKIINKLRERGFAFSADLDLARLGLYRCFIFLDDFVDYKELPFKEALRTYAEIMPKGTAISYYAPCWNVDDATRKLIEKLGVERRNILITEVTFSSKPKLSLYFDLKHRDVVYDWSRVAKSFEEYLSYPEPQSPQYAKVDSIDILIVRELELDPFASMKEISRKIGEDYGRVRWHFLNHVVGRGLIRGIRLRLPPMPTLFLTMAIVKDELKVLSALARAISEHPAFGGAHLSLRSKTLIVIGSVPPEHMRGYVELLDSVARKWEMLFINPYSVQSFTVPFGRFSPLEGWRLFVDSS